VGREQVFWGWGEPGAGPSLSDAASSFLRAELGLDGGIVSRPVGLADVRLRPPALPADLRARLGEVAELRDDAAARVLRCRGKSYLDLLAQRAGDCEAAPDAVVAPDSHDAVAAIVQACSEAGVAVVPFGGGTSVVGGLEPERHGAEALISLDLGRMDRVLAVDERSLTATLQPGLRLPEAERALGERGLALGHVPQSYEWATVGGCVATRSAGQASSGVGRIDANVVSLRAAAPAGDLTTATVPASAAGPSLRELLVGSEGALGVLTELTLRVRPTPIAQRYEGWFAHSFGEGADALRKLAQAGLSPDVARLSDEDETRMSLAFAGTPRLVGQVLRARGYPRGCLMVFGWEGRPEAIARRRSPAARILRSSGAMYVGQPAGATWRKHRFAGPYLRDDMLDRGVMVETLETATTWSRLAALHRAVGEALRGALQATPPLVACHVSHLYATGASLYFTVMARQAAAPVAQWRAAKAAASDAIAAHGATITHHHAVGRDHAPWLGHESSELGLELLRAVKERVDPAWVMNPGVLLRAEERGRNAAAAPPPISADPL
jgi:alkyldihydroxyacetonephosphate synthase